MTDDEWREIADRIASTWPGEPGAADRYREALDDLDPRAVETAIDGLLIEHRNEAPPPRVVRERAREVPAAEIAPFEPTAWDDAEAAGPHAVAEAPTGPASRPVGEAPAESPKATVALILGVASLVTIPVVVAVIAIVVANRALDEIARTPGLGGERRARVGRGLAYAGLIIFAVVVVVAIASGLAD